MERSYRPGATAHAIGRGNEPQVRLAVKVRAAGLPEAVTYALHGRAGGESFPAARHSVAAAARVPKIDGIAC